MHTLLAVGVVLTAAVFSSVQCDRYILRQQYQHQPRLLLSGWGKGWGKKPIVAVSKGWGWKIPTIKGIGIYGGIRVHHGLSQGGGKGWGSVSSGGWGGGGGGGGQGGWGGWGHGGGGHGGGGHGGWGGWGQKQQGWGWGHGGGGGGGGGHGGWGGWGGQGGYGGGHDDDDYERSSLPILVQEADSVEDSSAESGEVQLQERSDYFDQAEFDYAPYFEPVFYQ